MLKLNEFSHNHRSSKAIILAKYINLEFLVIKKEYINE